MLLVASALCAGVVVVAATPVAATYPGESGRVAYTDATEIYTMNPDGSDRRRITYDGGVYVQSVRVEDFHQDYYTWSRTPKWSPDGSMLAFLHYAVDDTTEIRIVDPFSGLMEVLFADWHGTMISWSPDGKRIAYSTAIALTRSGCIAESTGLVYFRNSNTQGIADYSFYFGDPGDRLIAGDWNRDGNDSPAVYRPVDRTFDLRYTNTQGTANEQFLWGWPHWLLVAGNLDVD